MYLERLIWKRNDMLDQEEVGEHRRTWLWIQKTGLLCWKEVAEEFPAINHVGPMGRVDSVEAVVAVILAVEVEASLVETR